MQKVNTDEALQLKQQLVKKTNEPSLRQLNFSPEKLIIHIN